MAHELESTALAIVVFALISSPFMYGITNSILGKVVATTDVNNVPTIAGLILHSIVFGGIVFGLMQVLFKQ